MATFSVILPNYNHAQYLDERIQSILKQTHQDFELIILDDASSDNSKQVIEKYISEPRCRKVVINKENSGSPYHQWEMGIRLATNEWIWVAESDDFAHPDFLLKINATIEADKDLSLVYSDSVILDDGTKNNADLPPNFKIWRNKLFQTDKWDHSYSVTGIAEINSVLKWHCTINNASSAVFRKSKIEKMLHRLPEFKFHGDWFMYLVSLMIGKVAYIQDELSWYRTHPENFSKRESMTPSRKTEYFKILDYLLKQKQINEKKQLLIHFIKHYVGFGLWKDRALLPFGIFWKYFSINKRLACSIAINIIRSKNDISKL